MTRTERVVYAGYPHHLTLRGNNRRKLFGRSTDFSRFLFDLARAAERTKCAIHALTLMHNHVHLIVTPPVQEALGAFVHSCAQRYAQLRNARRQASGKLFEERYFSKPLLADADVGRATIYAELNPVRAGLVEDPADWRWSTYPLHVCESERSAVPVWLWTPSAWYLSLGGTGEARAVAYRELVRDSARQPPPEMPPRARDIVEPYTLRLERPDGCRCCEGEEPYGGRVARSRLAGQ